MTKTADAWDELLEAMNESRPTCRGDDRFTVDDEDLTVEDRAAMDALCVSCPLKQLCRSYAAAAKPTGGRWAGRSYNRHQSAAAA